MDTTIYKTLEECATLGVSHGVYVVTGDYHKVEDLFPRNYYAVRHYNSGEVIYFYDDRDHRSGNCPREINDAEVFHYLTKAVSRRGVTAVIRDSYDSGRSYDWAYDELHPTFRVDGVLCVCTGKADDMYSFLPLSEFIKQLYKQKKWHDERCRRDYQDGNY